MTVENYLAKHEEGKIERDTIAHEMSKIYIALGEKLRDGTTGKIISERLNEQLINEYLADVLTDMGEYARKRWKVQSNRGSDLDELVSRTAGFRASDIGEFLTAKIGIYDHSTSQNELLKHLKDNTAYGYYEQSDLIGRPAEELSIDDALEVLTHTRVTDLVDQEKVELKHLKLLMAQYITSGSVGKPFIVEKEIPLLELDEDTA